jgi:hypothetical protein
MSSWLVYLISCIRICTILSNITYLAGVEQEEGGEKWRAGDAQKAMRFFMRAIEIYDNGINKYPTSFDLAYNKYVSNMKRKMIDWTGER